MTEPKSRTVDEMVAGADLAAVFHSLRFRKVANGYARRVAMAYGRDLAAVAGDNDNAVAERVAAYERSLGLEPLDWRAVGAEERDPDFEPKPDSE